MYTLFKVAMEDHLLIFALQIAYAAHVMVGSARDKGVPLAEQHLDSHQLALKLRVDRKPGNVTPH